MQKAFEQERFTATPIIHLKPAMFLVGCFVPPKHRFTNQNHVTLSDLVVCETLFLDGVLEYDITRREILFVAPDGAKQPGAEFTKQ